MWSCKYTNVSKEHIVIMFRDEGCTFRNLLAYMSRLRRKQSWDTRRGNRISDIALKKGCSLPIFIHWHELGSLLYSLAFMTAFLLTWLRNWANSWIYTIQLSSIMFFWNISICKQDYMMSEPKRPQSWQLSLWKPQNLYKYLYESFRHKTYVHYILLPIISYVCKEECVSVCPLHFSTLLHLDTWKQKKNSGNPRSRILYLLLVNQSSLCNEVLFCV
jgi:hypothetical protein